MWPSFAPQETEEFDRETAEERVQQLREAIDALKNQMTYSEGQRYIAPLEMQLLQLQTRITDIDEAIEEREHYIAEVPRLIDSFDVDAEDLEDTIDRLEEKYTKD